VVHGFDMHKSRVNTAAELCMGYSGEHCFVHANLNEWATLKQQQSRMLLPIYDIVLYLGIQHHLKYPGRLATLAEAASLAGKIFAIRTTGEVYQGDEIDRILAARGLVEVAIDKDLQRDGFGVARVFERRYP
jgi:hypothetical protein